jgi:hypothetical protein
MTIRSGTSSNGTLYFSDATGTGAGTFVGKIAYEHSNNKMLFSTNSTNRLAIDSSGNVGIGTTSPTAGVKLHLTNATQVNQYLESTGNATNSILQTGADGNSAYVFNRANAALTFGTNNTEKMRIDSSGRVGIGKTPNRSRKLEVAGTMNLDDGSEYEWGDGSISIGGNSSTDVMTFATAGAERMRIASDGSALFRPSTSSDNFGFEVRTGNSSDTGIKIGRTGTNNAQMGIVVHSNGASSYANLIMKHSDTLAFNSAANISLRDGGLVRIQSAFSNDTYATHRAVYAEDQGELGYAASVRASKTNIQDLSDVSWLLNLEPKTFNKRLKNEDGSYSETEHSNILEVGLIAEDVESENNILCFYDVNRTTDDDGNETVTQTNLAGIRYEMLAVPLLKLVQEQQTLIESLEARITALEN